MNIDIDMNSMEQYIQEYDTYTTNVVYFFNTGSGGIGDCMKYFMYVLQICIQHKYKLYYCKCNTTLEKYLLMKHDKMYIDQHKLNRENTMMLREFGEHSKTIIEEHTNKNKNIKYFIVRPFACYKTFKDIYDSLTIPFQDVFTFHNDVIKNKEHIFPTINSSGDSDIGDNNMFHSIHLRLGDKFLETDKKFVVVKNDTRGFEQHKIVKYIQDHSNIPILFFCDNQNYKEKMCEKFDNLYQNNCIIGHTSLFNTTEKQILDAITEFYILTQSNVIVAASKSGFSLVAAKYKPNTELIKLF